MQLSFSKRTIIFRFLEDVKRILKRFYMKSRLKSLNTKNYFKVRMWKIILEFEYEKYIKKYKYGKYIF